MASLGRSDTGLIPEKLTEYQFKVVIWTFTVVAFPFVPFRLGVRWRVFHRLFVDDAFVVLAYILLLTYTSIWSNRADDLYAVFDVGAGYTKAGPDFLSHFDRFRTAELAVVILFGCCLWSIKAAFLLFFRRLGNQVNHQRTIWWCIVAWNVATFIVFLGIRNWRCTANSTKYTVAHCADVATAKFSQRSLEIQTAMDVLSDASMFIIPTTLLWRVQMTTRKKLALGGIFSLTIFIMAASITRVLVVTQKNSSIDETWMYSWSVIEMSIAVIVACLASFRALFSSHTISQRLPDYNARDPERRALHNKRYIDWSSSSLTPHQEPHRLERWDDGLGLGRGGDERMGKVLIRDDFTR